MAPLGKITLVYDKPHNRGSWAPQVHEGCYVSPSILHYRCLKLYTPKTSKERVSDNTKLFPATLTLPIISSKDTETHADADLTHYLLNPTTTSQLISLGDKQTESLRQLAEIFTKAAAPPKDTTSEGSYPRVNTRRVPCVTSEGGPTRGHIIPIRTRIETTTSTCTPPHPR